MSNGDDVLDNWEEIDEAVLNSSVQALKILSTSCERITESYLANSTVAAANTSSSGLSEMKVLQRSNNQETTVQQMNKSPLDNMSDTFQPVLMVLHKPQDEYQSANYTAPIANQTVKILRRPTQSTEIRNNGVRPRQPIKTLQQREQEYAEARLRILGSAKNPEDEEQRASTITTSVVTSISNSTPTTPTAATVVTSSNNSVTNMVSNTKVNSQKVQLAANQYNNHYNQQLQQQKYQQNYQQQQQQQQSYFYDQQQPQSPAYNNNRTYNMNPLLALGPMGSIGQPAQYQPPTLVAQQAQQQHLKYQQYHQKSPQQQHKNQQQQQQTWSPVVGGSVSSSSIRQQPNDTILRLPRGPNGSTGFQMHR